MLESWEALFLGELGAAAAFAGLLFVSLSVNQAHILSQQSAPERGIQSLWMLFLIFCVSAIMLVPHQSPRAVGGELLGVSLVHFVTLTISQVREHRTIQPAYRWYAWLATSVGQAALWMILASAVGFLVRNDWLATYGLVPATLIGFLIAALNAWVLLIEINR
ncbi:MAG: hypothetical protein JNJ73_15925 [Hyphomonadaceae bacterium]|nr:hypothetical protein [Hyphomonadaceae bacterium]